MKSGFFSLKKLPRGVWLITVTSAILMSGVGMIVPFIPVYSKQLGASPAELGLLMSGLFVGRLTAQIPAGVAADRFGRKSVLLTGLLGYMMTCSGYALSETAVWLIGFRLLQGISAGFFGVSARALISDLTEPRHRGTAQGVYSAAVNLGFMTGPIVGALAVERLSMSVPFWTAAGLSGTAILALSNIKFPPAPKRETALIVPLRAVLAAAKNTRVRLTAIAHLFFMSGLSVIMTLFPVAGSSEIRGGLIFVGTALTIAGASGFVLGPLAGRLSDRVGRAPLMLSGALLASCEGIALLLTRDPWVIGLSFFAGGVGAASFFNALHAGVGDMTKRKERGKVTGMVGLAGEAGGIIGSLIAPLVWAGADLRAPFALQIIATFMVVVFVSWLWRIGPPRPVLPASVRETILPG